MIGADTFFTSRSRQLAKLTVDHAVPAIYEFREFTTAGGLMSYGTDEKEYYRVVGTYTGKVLKGEKPVDLAGRAIYESRNDPQSQDRQGARRQRPTPR